MGLLNIFKKNVIPAKPYAAEATNLIYDLLFCDNIALYKNNFKGQLTYPWDSLLSENPDPSELEKIIEDDPTEARAKILAYRRMYGLGQQAEKKELLGIIIEIGLDNGLDVLAAYGDNSARYINQSESVVVLEAPDEQSAALIDQLFVEGINVVKQIGPWTKPRLPRPVKGNVRLSFLVSDGLYFGEGLIDVMFNDSLACGVLNLAAGLMKHITEKASAAKG